MAENTDVQNSICLLFERERIKKSAEIQGFGAQIVLASLWRKTLPRQSDDYKEPYLYSHFQGGQPAGIRLMACLFFGSLAVGFKHRGGGFHSQPDKHGSNPGFA
jgi:hypothetical protein